VRATRPVSLSLHMSNAHALRGTVSAQQPTVINVKTARQPRSVRVNGASVQSRYDQSTRTISFSVGAGTSLIEWD
jgi:hypothetical protein